MIALIVLLLVVSIALPLGYAWRVYRLDQPSQSAWLLHVADAGVIVALVLLVSRWDIAGFYTRPVLLALFVATILWSFWTHRSRPWCVPAAVSLRAAQHPLRQHWTTAVSLTLLGAALAYCLWGALPPPHAHELALPLGHGRFMVAQGGRVGLLNRHVSHAEQRFAADITAIGPAGFRARGLLPSRLDRYAIYDVEVVAPCTGSVLFTRDGLPDLTPPARDPDNAAGNHVIIDCGDIHVELAHMKEGSVAVAAGDLLDTGDHIGRVGNSGNTTEPHLHVHAVDPVSRRGVPISFDGRVPVRNRVYLN